MKIRMKKSEPSAKSFFFTLLALIVICLPFYLVRFSIGRLPTTLLEILIYVAFIYGLFSKQIKIKADATFYISLLFVLSGLVAVFTDPQIIRAAGLWKAYFFDGFLLFMMIMSLEKNEKNNILIYLSTGGAMTALIALGIYFLGIKSTDGRLLDLDRLSPNYLSMFLIPSFIATVFLAINYYRDRGRLIYFAFCSAIIALALLLTGSRAIYLSLPVGLIIMLLAFMKAENRKFYKTLAIVISVAVIILGAWFFRPSFGDMGRTGSSSNIRYYIWTTSVEIISKSPVLGIGLSNFQDYFTNLTDDRVNYSAYIAPQALTAHNLYLQLYLTVGLLGIITFVLLVFTSVRKSKNIVIIAMMVSILVYGLVDTPFFRNDLAGLFWIVLALL